MSEVKKIPKFKNYDEMAEFKELELFLTTIESGNELMRLVI